jgi:hypothetical protein
MAYNPYRIRSTDSSLTVPKRLTFPNGTFVQAGGPSTVADGQFGGADGLLSQLKSFASNLFSGPTLNNLPRKGLNPYLSAPKLQTVNDLRPANTLQTVNTLQPYVSNGLNAVGQGWAGSGGGSGTGISGLGNIVAPAYRNTGADYQDAPFRRYTDRIVTTFDQTGTMDTNGLLHLAEASGQNPQMLKDTLIGKGFIFDPISGTYSNPQMNSSSAGGGGGSGGDYNPYTVQIGKDWYRPLGGGAYQAKPGTAGNWSGGSIRNAKGNLINGGGGGGRGGSSKPAGPQRTDKGEGNVNFRGATG